jgi:tetratricopeptide (TPR) repeat protein
MDNAIQLKEHGTELFRAGRFEEAADQFQQAYHAYLAAGDLVAAGRACNDQGVCWRQAARFDEAEKCLLAARSLFKKAGDLGSEAQALGNLAALYESRKDDVRAIELYRETAKLLEGCNEANLSRDTWLALARLRLRRREWLPAIAAYDEGLSQATQLSASQRALRVLLRMARRVAGWS